MAATGWTMAAIGMVVAAAVCTLHKKQREDQDDAQRPAERKSRLPIVRSPLPPTIMEEVASFIEAKYLAVLCCVSKEWVPSNASWRRLVLRDYGTQATHAGANYKDLYSRAALGWIEGLVAKSNSLVAVGHTVYDLNKLKDACPCADLVTDLYTNRVVPQYDFDRVRHSDVAQQAIKAAVVKEFPDIGALRSIKDDVHARRPADKSATYDCLSDTFVVGTADDDVNQEEEASV